MQKYFFSTLPTVVKSVTTKNQESANVHFTMVLSFFFGNPRTPTILSSSMKSSRASAAIDMKNYT